MPDDLYSPAALAVDAETIVASRVVVRVVPVVVEQVVVRGAGGFVVG